MNKLNITCISFFLSSILSFSFLFFSNLITLFLMIATVRLLGGKGFGQGQWKLGSSDSEKERRNKSLGLQHSPKPYPPQPPKHTHTHLSRPDLLNFIKYIYYISRLLKKQIFFFTQKSIVERLNEGEVIIGDGGFCYALERRGYVMAGTWTPECVVENPEAGNGAHARLNTIIKHIFSYLELFAFLLIRRSSH